MTSSRKRRSMLGHACTGGPRLGVNLCAGRNRNVKKSREVSGKRIRIMKNGAGAMSACPVSFIRLPEVQLQRELNVSCWF